MADARQHLTARALARGFEVVRFATVGPTPHAEAFARWLDAGHHADMDWLRDTADVRADPRRREASARTAMVMAVHHAWDAPPDPGGRTGRVARYAWGRDYHNLVGKRLRKLVRDLREDGLVAWGGVDTAPIVERSWAAASGLGFSGKNAVQIVPAQGSWFFLAVVFVDADAAPDPPLGDHCGRCRRCLDACPTEAFVGPRTLDARRCIAYWTIEARALPPRDLRPGLGRWVFGCDVCQEVCPHNVRPPDPDDDDLRPRHAWLDLDTLLATPDGALMDRFLGTPLRRPRAAGLKRNALLVLGNLGDPGGLPSIDRGLRHEDGMVRAAAVWAGAQLGSPPTPGTRDPDPRVQAEIDAILGDGPARPPRG